jgi:hypothetical protein
VAILFPGCATAGSTHVSFNPVPAATGYLVLNSVNADLSHATTNQVTAPDLTVTGLPVGTNYIAVQAISDTARGDLTPPVMALVPATGTTTITLKP